MKCAFCCLETDDKTFNYVREYYELIQEGVSLYKLDLSIQRREIDIHLRNNNISQDNQFEITEWINKNSPNFRSYLNSIKLIAFYLYTYYKGNGLPFPDEKSYNFFLSAVKAWNEKKSDLIDSLFI